MFAHVLERFACVQFEGAILARICDITVVCLLEEILVQVAAVTVVAVQVDEEVVVQCRIFVLGLKVVRFKINEF